MKLFNRKLKKIVKVYQHMSVLEMNNDRKLFTNHILHLNGQGKEVLSKLSLTHIQYWNRKWIPNNFKLEIRSNLTVPLYQVKVMHGTSTRSRKTPSMKCDDFLW